MSDELDKLTDAQLSEVFAHEVAGWINQGCAKNMPSLLRKWKTNNGNKFWDTRIDPLPFATSADAVLPYLEKTTFRIDRVRLPDGYIIYIEKESASGGWTYNKAEATTLPRAACLALIKAKRAEKGQP